MLARFYLLAAVIIWGWTFVATKICLQFLSPAELLSARFLMAIASLTRDCEPGPVGNCPSKIENVADRNVIRIRIDLGVFDVNHAISCANT